MTRIFFCLVALVATAGLGCAGSAPGGIHYASGKGAVTPDGLHRIDWEPFKITFVKPGADLQRYGKVLVEEVTVSYKTPPRSAQLERYAIAPNYALPDSAVASMKRYFHEAFVKALGKSQSFSVTDSPGPDVLLISGHIVNLKITVPPERDQGVDETDYASSSGQMTLILDAQDSTSGEPLVRVGQARAIQLEGGGWHEADPVTNSAAVRQTFQTWASDLRRELDQFHALTELPPVSGESPAD
jgi:hypothetical protein